jgi:hypothetical protein
LYSLLHKWAQEDVNTLYSMLHKWAQEDVNTLYSLLHKWAQEDVNTMYSLLHKWAQEDVNTMYSLLNKNNCYLKNTSLQLRRGFFSPHYGMRINLYSTYATTELRNV